MNRLICMMLILLGVKICNATPTVKNILGELTKNAEITIIGSSFGIHSDYSPDVENILNVGWHDFENGQYQGLGVTLQAVSRDAANFEIVSDNMNRLNSDYYLKKQYINSEGGCYGLRDKGDFNVWYWSFWFYMPENNQSGKFSRLWGSSDVTDQDYFYVSAGGANYYFRGGSYGRSTQWSSPDSFEPNKWSRVELVFNKTEHMVLAYMDGKLEWTHNDWLPASFQANGQLWEVSGMIDGPSRDYYNTNGSYNFDDVYFDHTIARVEISDSEQWGEDVKSHREIQIPVEWSDTQIKITFNQGSFSEGNQVYLFVVDSNGNVSQGYPLTIGQSYGQAKDVNQDGSVNIQDVQLVVNVILGNVINSRADVNGDGSTNVSDVQTVINEISD